MCPFLFNCSILEAMARVWLLLEMTSVLGAGGSKTEAVRQLCRWGDGDWRGGGAHTLALPLTPPSWMPGVLASPRGGLCVSAQPRDGGQICRSGSAPLRTGGGCVVRRGGRRPRGRQEGTGEGRRLASACGLPTPSQHLLPGQLLPDSLHLERIHCTDLASPHPLHPRAFARPPPPPGCAYARAGFAWRAPSPPFGSQLQHHLLSVAL